MEERDRSRSPSRRTSRVEQVVGRWLRRSRESSSRERILVDGKTAAGESSGQDQKNYPVRLTVQISRDQQLNSHGLTLSPQTPVLVQDVTPEGPADGRLVPGDQVVKINNVAVEDLTPEQAADLIRECPDCVTITVLRNSVGPKSSFITPEKRAKLRSNPVKVHFAEEVEVNGHSQGNSLLFLPNVLKVYLENGQTKAFKFEPNTTVKDIVMTLKEKLSLCRIEHFSLVLEQKYSIAKLLLLHEEERIQQVVQKKEVHDYRCLFRVCFMPREPQHLLQNDPTAFEYLYLQGINDVLQERFAVEMRCNTALRLAALHIQERLASCGQSPKTNLKIITKSWGIENFVSSTLLRNMREKDLRKAIGYHMKKSQSQEPKQKVLSANQARINYLQELCELKSFGGKSFSATMMLQDRESMVTLLVGSRYGISQVVNHKLSIMSTLTEFSSITRIELLPESDRVSLVKIYLQDIKPITLMLESVAAKELSCLIAGYCRALVDPSLVIFPWVQNAKQHRVSTEEGYVSRCGSDSDDSSDIDTLISLVSHNSKRTSSDPVGLRRIMEERKEERKERKEREEKKRRENERKEKGEGEQEKHVKYRTMSPPRKKRENERIEKSEVGGVDQRQKNRGTLEDNRERENANEEATGQEENKGGVGEREEEDLGGTTEELPSLSETSDSCRTDSRFMTSVSSDSLDALEEDDLIACSSSLPHSHTHPPFRLTVQPPHPQPQPRRGASSTQEAGGRRGGEGFGAGYRSGSGGGTLPDPLLSPVNPDPVNTEQLTPVVDPSENMNYAELSLMLEYLPSPPEASDDEDDEDEERRKREGVNSGSGRPRSSSSSSRLDCVFTFDQSDTRCYYNICTSVTPDSAHTPNLSPPHANTEAAEVVGAEGEPRAVLNLEPVPILQPPPGFGDSSSDEEFFDARDRFASPEDPTSGAVPRDFSAEMTSGLMERTVSPSDVRVSLAEGEGEDEKEGRDGDVSEGGRGGRDMFSRLSRKRSKKRRSFMETDFTSTVSYPGPDQNQGWKVDQYPDQFQSWMESPDDTQLLSLDPQSSEQSGNPCLTVSSLSHAEGEACQLESKPILPKPSQDGPGDPRAPGNPEAELRRSSRSRRQSMETEPDVMESKSVTALVTAASHAITAVRRRVGPDGKESTDRRGDGEEGEAEGEEKVGEGERGGVGTGPFTSHMFLTETKHVEGDRGEKTKGEGGEKLPSPISEGPPTGNRSRFNRRPLCITKEEEGKASFVPQICVSPPGVYGRDLGPEDNVTLTPPSSPLPSLPAPFIPHMVRGEGSSENSDSGPRPKPSPTSDPENHYSCLTQAHRKLTISHEDLTGVGKDIEPNATSGKDSVTDNSYVATPNICDVMANNKATVSTDCLLATANRKDPTSVQSVTANTIANTNMDVVTANLDLAAANNDTNASVYSTMANSDVSTSVYSAMANSDANASINSAIPSVHITGTSVLANIPKESPASPTTGVLQSCSPGIIGQSLSASTLRGKIQSLPLFLSRSQERALSSRSPSPKPTSDKAALNGTTKIETARKDDVTVEDSNDSLEAPAESEESEVTPTELELGDVVVETAGAEITRLRVSEVKEVVEKVVMVYGSSPPPSTSVCLDSEPDPKMAANLPSRPIPEAETTPPMASAPLCLGPASDHEPLSTGSIGPKMALPLHSCPSAPPCPSGPPCSSAPPCPSAPPCSSAPPCPSAPVPIRVGPKPDQEPLSLGYKMTNLSSSCPSALVRTTHSLDPLTVTSGPTISTEPKQDPHPEPLTPVPKMSTMLPSCSSALVVTTQSLNGPRLSFPGRNIVGQSFEGNRPPGEEPGLLNSLTTGCGVFTATAHEARSELAPTQLGSSPPAKPDFGCTSVLASGCKEVLEGVQTPLEVCGCPPPLVYTNCFSGGDSFDDELTVYEFSCRASSPPASQTSSSALALPLMTSPPLSSFLPSSPPSSFLSPSFPCSVLPPFSSPELSPLLSPLLSPSDCFLSQSRLQDDIGRLRHRRYPAPPTGFQAIRSDVDELLTLLQEGRLGGRGGRHPRETCATHFTENKRLLHGEARRLMAGCQKVVRVGQTPDEMLLSLADSFRTLVGMAGVCLWFSGCDRCDRRNADALAGLADVARTYREFAVAAERASGRRSCHDLSTKLLAKQCTALTASVFCLTQLFRTLTAL